MNLHHSQHSQSLLFVKKSAKLAFLLTQMVQSLWKKGTQVDT
jgi:hypothetical protein